jgi:hypothetical protein
MNSAIPWATAFLIVPHTDFMYLDSDSNFFFPLAMDIFLDHYQWGHLLLNSLLLWGLHFVCHIMNRLFMTELPYLTLPTSHTLYLCLLCSSTRFECTGCDTYNLGFEKGIVLGFYLMTNAIVKTVLPASICPLLKSGY